MMFPSYYGEKSHRYISFDSNGSERIRRKVPRLNERYLENILRLRLLTESLLGSLSDAFHDLTVTVILLLDDRTRLSSVRVKLDKREIERK